jgi:Uma2 family endonuclease
MHSSQLVTAEDLERMGRAGFSFELVGGRLVRMNPPNHEHGRIALDLGAELRRVVRASDLGHVVVESGYTLTRNPDTVRGPDVSFVRKGRPNYPPTSGFFAGAPDLAVEVRSPDDTIAQLLGKAAEYLDAGAELVWIVDPEDATVRVLRRGAAMVTLGANDVLDGATTVPGFQLPLNELFAAS